jgi:hypothetical protein
MSGDGKIEAGRRNGVPDRAMMSRTRAEASLFELPWLTQFDNYAGERPEAAQPKGNAA